MFVKPYNLLRSLQAKLRRSEADRLKALKQVEALKARVRGTPLGFRAEILAAE